MYIDSISSYNFKCFKHKINVVGFSPGINVICGLNGTGKTSFLELISDLLTLTKEFKLDGLYSGYAKQRNSFCVTNMTIYNNEVDSSFPLGPIVLKRVQGNGIDKFMVFDRVLSKKQLINLFLSIGIESLIDIQKIKQNKILFLKNNNHRKILKSLLYFLGISNHFKNNKNLLFISLKINNLKKTMNQLLQNNRKKNHIRVYFKRKKNYGLISFFESTILRDILFLHIKFQFNCHKTSLVAFLHLKLKIKNAESNITRARKYKKKWIRIHNNTFSSTRLSGSNCSNYYIESRHYSSKNRPINCVLEFLISFLLEERRKIFYTTWWKSNIRNINGFFKLTNRKRASFFFIHSNERIKSNSFTKEHSLTKEKDVGFLSPMNHFFLMNKKFKKPQISPLLLSCFYYNKVYHLSETQYHFSRKIRICSHMISRASKFILNYIYRTESLIFRNLDYNGQSSLNIVSNCFKYAPDLQGEIFGYLFDLVYSHKLFYKAIQNVAGEKLFFIVVKNKKTVERILQKVKEKIWHKISFLFNETPVNKKRIQRSIKDGVRLDNVLYFRLKFREVVESCFGEIFIVKSIKGKKNFFPEIQNDFVTIDGDFCYRNGYFKYFCPDNNNFLLKNTKILKIERSFYNLLISTKSRIFCLEGIVEKDSKKISKLREIINQSRSELSKKLFIWLFRIQKKFSCVTYLINKRRVNDYKIYFYYKNKKRRLIIPKTRSFLINKFNDFKKKPFFVFFFLTFPFNNLLIAPNLPKRFFYLLLKNTKNYCSDISENDYSSWNKFSGNFYQKENLKKKFRFFKLLEAPFVQRDNENIIFQEISEKISFIYSHNKFKLEKIYPLIPKKNWVHLFTVINIRLFEDFMIITSLLNNYRGGEILEIFRNTNNTNSNYTISQLLFLSSQTKDFFSIVLQMSSTMTRMLEFKINQTVVKLSKTIARIHRMVFSEGKIKFVRLKNLISNLPPEKSKKFIKILGIDIIVYFRKTMAPTSYKLLSNGEINFLTIIVKLACGICKNTKVFILDEMDSFLDDHVTEKVSFLLKSFSSFGIQYFITTFKRTPFLIGDKWYGTFVYQKKFEVKPVTKNTGNKMVKTK